MTHDGAYRQRQEEKTRYPNSNKKRGQGKRTDLSMRSAFHKKLVANEMDDLYPLLLQIISTNKNCMYTKKSIRMTKDRWLTVYLINTTRDN